MHSMVQKTTILRKTIYKSPSEITVTLRVFSAVLVERLQRPAVPVLGRIRGICRLGDDDVESNGAASPSALALGKLQGGVVTANAATNAGKSLALLVVARTTAEAVGVANLDDGSILEGSRKLGLVVEGGLAGDGEPLASVALEADVSGARLLGAGPLAFTEHEDKAACLALGRGGDVELGEGAQVAGGNLGRLAGGKSLVGVLLGDNLEEGWVEGAGRKLASGGNGLDNRACLATTRSQGETVHTPIRCRSSNRKGEKHSEESGRLLLERL